MQGIDKDSNNYKKKALFQKIMEYKWKVFLLLPFHLYMVTKNPHYLSQNTQIGTQIQQCLKMNVPDESGINEEITNQPRPQDYSTGYQVTKRKQSGKYKNTENIQCSLFSRLHYLDLTIIQLVTVLGTQSCKYENTEKMLRSFIRRFHFFNHKKFTLNKIIFDFLVNFSKTRDVIVIFIVSPIFFVHQPST